jgi:Zn-dependent protease with chaperone function
MTKLYGELYDNKSSKKSKIILEFSGENVTIKKNGELFLTAKKDEFQLSSRVANIPRILKVKDYTIYSKENDKLDKLFKTSLAHRLESKSHFALLSLIFVILTTIFFLTIGSSYISKMIAKFTPHIIEDKISKSTLKTLDSYILKESKLPKTKQDEIKKLFKKITNNDPKYHLYFRRGMGENAFALPNGDIVILDELIEFSDGDMNMIYGVLAHEKGHIVYKHSMQMIIKASLITAIITYLTGDVSTLATTLSTSLLNAKYSREFEREADAYAKKNMLENGINPKHLANFFIKMSKKYKNSNKNSFFASHPTNKDRIKELLR